MIFPWKHHVFLRFPMVFQHFLHEHPMDFPCPGATACRWGSSRASTNSSATSSPRRRLSSGFLASIPDEGGTWFWGCSNSKWYPPENSHRCGPTMKVYIIFQRQWIFTYIRISTRGSSDLFWILLGYLRDLTRGHILDIADHNVGQ